MRVTRRGFVVHGMAVSLVPLRLATGCHDEPGSDGDTTDAGADTNASDASTGETTAAADATTSGDSTSASETGADDHGSTGNDACEPTLPNAEGPYYTPGAPERNDLTEPGMVGTRLTLRGVVYDETCSPVAGAVLDFWQADAEGVYDNEGYTLRGQLATDSDGTYELRTIVPAHYMTGPDSFRPAHIHVKVSAAGQATLTTQLYFAGDPFNESDGLFREELVIATQMVGDEVEGSFDFVLPPS